MELKIVVDADQALRLLKIPKGELVRNISEAAVDAVLDVALEDPPQTHDPQPFVSDKQRRFFFAALRDGTIDVPYIRTGEMVESWDPQYLNDGAVLSNSSDHAFWALAKDTRTSYFQGGPWMDEYDIADEAEGPVGTAAADEVERMIGP